MPLGKRRQKARPTRHSRRYSEMRKGKTEKSQERRAVHKRKKENPGKSERKVEPKRLSGKESTYQ